MLTQFSRTELLLGKEAMDRLKNARVAVFGIGGVGGYVCEALVRTGVGAFDLIDDDKVCLTNLNRQIIATRKTVGKYKTEVMKERMLEINPDVKVEIHDCFFLPENAKDFPFEEYDYIVDAGKNCSRKGDGSARKVVRSHFYGHPDAHHEWLRSHCCDPCPCRQPGQSAHHCHDGKCLCRGRAAGKEHRHERAYRQTA